MFVSGLSYVMILMVVDVKDNKLVKWMVENSWGVINGYQGYLIMMDEWFDEYMFCLVVEKKFVIFKVLEILKQKLICLFVWDLMFVLEQ